MPITHQGGRVEMPFVIFTILTFYTHLINKACWASCLDYFRWLSICTWFPYSPVSKQKSFAATQGEAFGFNKENLRQHFQALKASVQTRRGRSSSWNREHQQNSDKHHIWLPSATRKSTISSLIMNTQALSAPFFQRTFTPTLRVSFFYSSALFTLSQFVEAHKNLHLEISAFTV